MSSTVPQEAAEAVLVKSTPVKPNAVVVRGYDFEDEEVNYDALLKCAFSTGFQATHLGLAVEIVNSMVRLRPAAL